MILKSHGAPLKRHVLIDGRNLTGGRNGITRYVEQLMQAWPVSEGFRTTLISNKPVISNAVIPSGVDIFVDQSRWAKLPGTIWMQMRAKSIAKKLGATDFLGPQHVIPLNIVQSLNTGVIVHDLVFEKYPETMQRSNRIMSGRYAPRSIRNARHIFCVSETTLHDLQAYLNRPLPNAVVSYPGLTAQALGAGVIASSRPRGSSTRLLIVGSMEPRKNVAQFLKIFLELSTKHPEISLDMVSGDGWGQVLAPDFYERIVSHPMIKIHQGITDAELDSLYREVDFLIFPSIYEGFGLPILEAVGKCGVIANDIPIFAELANKIEGVKLMDFSLNENVVAECLASLIAENKNNVVRLPAKFKDQFRWDTCATTIAARMGLIDAPSKETVMQLGT